MPLEIRRKPDGSLKSNYWYGSFEVDGKRYVRKLGVRILGNPPPSLREDGDAAFERSRGEAKRKLEDFITDARGLKSAEALVQDLHQLKYGAKIQSYPVADLVKAWKAMPKKRRTLNARYAQDVVATLDRFLAFMAANHKDVKDASQVDRHMARAFMASEEKRGVADKTWNDSLKRVRATFKFLQAEYGLWRNPFDGLRMREETHQHRRPLTAEQITKLLASAADDNFSRPLIVCALSTAMRLGDCCQLKWAGVDIDSPSPSVTVKTSKTGETVCIPVYERLRLELETARARTGADAEYVWPEQAALYQRAHVLVSRRVGRHFAAAAGAENVHVTRKHGLLQASVIDFHSLRTTWITEALSRGVPIETVKLVSGHKTVEVVTTHYFHPSREQVRNALSGALPLAITGGETAPAGLPQAGAPREYGETKGPGDLLGEALELLEALPAASGQAWKQKLDTALALVRQAKHWVDGKVLREVQPG